MADIKELDKLSERIQTVMPYTEEEFKIELDILNCKILYFKGLHNESVAKLSSLKLFKVVSNYSFRVVKLIAEALAIIGLSKSNYESEEYMSELANSVLLSIRHFQDVSSPNDIYSIGNSMSYLIENAAQKYFLIRLNSKKYDDAIDWMRLLMRCRETVCTKNLRRIISKDLAELLLRGFTTYSYPKINTEKLETYVNKICKFRNPDFYPSNKVMPEDLVQESILMLLISDYLANPDAILGRSQVYADEREKNMKNTISVYDLLTISLVKSSSYTFLYERLESSLRFSFKEFHIWYQFALALINSKNYERAYLVLKECLRIKPDKTGVYLLSASLCLGHLNMIKEGIEFCQEAIKISTSKNEQLLIARARLLLGWGYHLAARQTKILSNKSELHWMAIEQYRQSVSLNPNDAFAWYHLSIELGNQRNVVEALVACKRSLCLNPIQPNSFLLLAIIHSAMPQMPVHNNPFKLTPETTAGNNTSSNPVQNCNNSFIAQTTTPSNNNSNCTNNNLNNDNSSSNEDISNSFPNKVQSPEVPDSNVQDSRSKEKPEETKMMNPKEKEVVPSVRISSKRRNLDLAYKALHAGLLENPNDIELLFALAKIELQRNGPAAAREIYFRLMEIWRNIYGGDSSMLNFIKNIYQNDIADYNSVVSEGTLPRTNQAKNPNGTLMSAISVPAFQPQYSSNELSSNNAIITINQNTFSGGMNFKNIHSQHSPTNTISDQLNRRLQGPNKLVFTIPNRVFIALAELCLYENQPDSAETYLQQLSSKSDEVQFLFGKINFQRNNLTMAKDKFEMILAKDPDHESALIELARVYLCQSNFTQAERVIRQALNIDPMRPDSWRILGDILTHMQSEGIGEAFDQKKFFNSLESVNENDYFLNNNDGHPGPMDEYSCQTDIVSMTYMKAIELENTEPFLPFFSIPIGFKI